MTKPDLAKTSQFSFQVSWYSVDLSGKKQLFLSYTPGKEHGPGIDRDGIGSPRMINAEAPWEKAWKDPENLRRCSWRAGDPGDTTTWNAEECTERRCGYFVQDPSTRTPAQTTGGEKIWDASLCNGDHCAYFRYIANGHWRIEAEQGCGNLSMNMWFVAYCQPIELEGGQPDVRRPRLLYLLDEGRLFSDPNRKYSCLVKWKAEHQQFPRLSIRDLRFNAFDRFSAAHIDDPRDEPARNITEDVEFAAFGQQVIRNAKTVDLATITHQFSDVRHLFRLPNLRPSFHKFGVREPDADLWFGEAELLEDPDTRRGALSRPALLKMTHKLGKFVPGVESEVERNVFRDAFQTYGYVEIPERPPVRPGEFRFDPASADFVDVWLIPNVYSYSFLGVGGPKTWDKRGHSNRLTFFVASGASGRQGLTLETAVETLRTQAKVHDALLIDQGLDVCQYAHSRWLVPLAPPVTDQQTRITQHRDRLRAVFILASKCPQDLT